MVDLLARVGTVSVETMKITGAIVALPAGARDAGKADT
jgi:hypothetical protein